MFMTARFMPVYAIMSKSTSLPLLS